MNQYKDVAEEKGYGVMQVLFFNEWFWFNDEQESMQKNYSYSETDAWKAACEDAGIVIEAGEGEKA